MAGIKTKFGSIAAVCCLFAGFGKTIHPTTLNSECEQVRVEPGQFLHKTPHAQVSEAPAGGAQSPVCMDSPRFSSDRNTV